MNSSASRSAGTTGAQWIASVLLVGLAFGPACSWLMVGGPPPSATAAVQSGASERELQSLRPMICNRNRTIPRIDRTIGTMHVAGGGLMAGGGLALLPSSDDYNRQAGAIFIMAGALSVAYAMPWLLSARSGYRKVAACRAAMAAGVPHAP